MRSCTAATSLSRTLRDAVDTGFVGHSYFGDVRSVLSDMFYLIRDGKRAAQRFGLRVVESQDGHYRAFKD
jgi:hypothetical protein